jgi:hypothetical protein
MEKISWTDLVRNEEVLHRVEEDRNTLHTIQHSIYSLKVRMACIGLRKTYNIIRIHRKYLCASRGLLMRVGYSNLDRIMYYPYLRF